MDQCLGFLYFIHFEFMCLVQLNGPHSFLCRWLYNFFQIHLLMTHFFTRYFFLLIEEQLPIELRVHFCVPCPFPLIYVLFLPVPGYLDDKDFIIELVCKYCFAQQLQDFFWPKRFYLFGYLGKELKKTQRDGKPSMLMDQNNKQCQGTCVAQSLSACNWLG